MTGEITEPEILDEFETLYAIIFRSIFMGLPSRYGYARQIDASLELYQLVEDVPGTICKTGDFLYVRETEYGFEFLERISVVEGEIVAEDIAPIQVETQEINIQDLIRTGKVWITENWQRFRRNTTQILNQKGEVK